jgi:hypothetical protein
MPDPNKSGKEETTSPCSTYAREETAKNNH